MIAPARKNILIVEDDQSISGEMAKTLERMGYEVTGVFASGEEFMEKAAKPAAPGPRHHGCVFSGLDGRYPDGQIC